MLKIILSCISLLIFVSPLLAQAQMDPAAAEKIDLKSYTVALKTLSADDYAGRFPASPEEEKVLNYLKTSFQDAGLEPGNGDSFFQDVPLVQVTTKTPSSLPIVGNGKEISLKHGTEFVAVTRRLQEQVEVENSEMIFVGYGVIAPEYDWNDYEGLDVRGKTVVLLVNDPGFITKDSTLFNGRSMTYYGRWTYKYEEAARQGAAGVMVIHQSAPAGYPWLVVQGGWGGGGAKFYLEAPDGNMSRCNMEGWISSHAAKQLFAAADIDYDQTIRAAAKRGFKPVSLGMSCSLTLKNSIERSTSRNVLAKLPGGDLSDEYIIYSAHWDHLGTREGMEGDNIFNGARDNASGTAALISLAKAFNQLPEKPRRSILFLAVTAEEQGLLGSAYYAQNPVYPLTKTVAALNMDALNILGQMKDITIIGEGNSELDNYVYEAARIQKRYIRPDPDAEKGLFFRSDHFSFAKQGVPALYTKMGVDHVEHGVDWAMEQNADWTRPALPQGNG